MSEKKFGKVLIVISVIVAIIIIALLGFWGYDMITKGAERRAAGEAINEAENNIRNQGGGYSSVAGPGNGKGNSRNNTANNNTSSLIDVNLTGGNETQGPNSTEQPQVKKQTYKGYTLAGYIEIPSIKLSPEKLPILERYNSGAGEASPGINYGPGLNKAGQTVVFGHNYHNGTHFSNLEKVKVNDTIYVTDLYNGHQRVKYTVYNIYETAANDFGYVDEDTQGARVITLSTCYGENNEDRTIVQARAE